MQVTCAAHAARVTQVTPCAPPPIHVTVSGTLVLILHWSLDTILQYCDLNWAIKSNAFRSCYWFECHQIQLCDSKCLIRYEYKGGSHQTKIIDLYDYKFPVSTVLLYYNSLYLNRSTRYSTSYSLYLNKLLTLPQQSTSYSLYLNSQQATRSTSTVNSSTSYNSDNNDN